jgi:hypothetical protein
MAVEAIPWGSFLQALICELVGTFRHVAVCGRNMATSSERCHQDRVVLILEPKQAGLVD